MGVIKILPENIANKIAAGEVVQRPASAVKELVENSLDAGSTDITVEVKIGGKELIRVIDNGAGMTQGDAVLALERHATSKIQSIKDMESITTMGFRGEALPSIASVSNMELITRTQEDMEGTRIKVEGGVTRDVERIGCPVGTRISIANLFYNIPARRKFLKATSTELGHIIKYVTWAGLAHPHISFKLIHNNNTVIEARRCSTVMERIHTLYGRDFARNVMEFKWDFETIKMEAYIGKPEFTKSNRDHQLFFLNRRPIKNKMLGAALGAAFQSVIPKGRYPVVILFLEIDPKTIDVNVHPAKTEVRFRDQRSVYNEVSRGLLMAMREQEYIPEIRTPTAEIPSPVQTEPSVPGHPRRAEVESSVSDFLNKQSRKATPLSHSSGSYPGRAEEFPKRIEKLPTIKRPPEPIALPLMDFESIQIKTRLFNTYIVAETGNEVLFIDQHIAEEKVLYEKLRKQMKQQGVPSQGLLLPVTVELSPAQAMALDSAMATLKRMGFDLEPFGGKSIVVRAVPVVAQRSDVKQMIMDIVEQIAASYGKQDDLELQQDALIMAACHSAVKAGDELSDAEVAHLLRELFNTAPPYMCPHGRPIIVRMNRSELEERFQRR